MNLKATICILGFAAFLQACEKSPPPANTANNANSGFAPSPSVEAVPAASTAGEKLPDAVYWGDTHLHTSYSFDAGAFGNTLDPNDEFADYENWDVGNLDASVPKTDDMLAGEYSREALKRGLTLEARLGINPYKFGLIGSTDSHTSLATTEEDNSFGKMATMEPGPQRMTDPVISGAAGTVYYRQTVASGLAAVWATENTREAIFNAMERKETYASTGPRMQVRVFAGWDFSEADLNSGDFVQLGYSKGVNTISSSDYSNKSANKNPITSRSDSGIDALPLVLTFMQGGLL